MTETPSKERSFQNLAVTDVPKSVKTACWLLLGSLIVDLCDLPIIIYSASPDDLRATLIVAAIILLIVGALTVFLVFKLQKRKSWARWAIALWVAMSMMMLLDSFPDDWVQYPIATLLGYISVAMGVGAVWLLFSSQSESWYFKASGGDAKTNIDPPLSGPERSRLNTFAYTCPVCKGAIPFLSKTVHSWGKVKSCPHCRHQIRPKLAYGKFFFLAFAIGFPVKMLGKLAPALTFVSGPIVSGLLMGIFVLICFRFESVPPNPPPPTPQS